MSNKTFQRAQRSQVFAKLAITGPTGSGKTFSALRLAGGLLNGTGKRIAFLDTENDSASLYSERFDFDVLPINRPFENEKFIEGINMAVSEGYGIVIIDSSSHFWEGVLEYKSKLDGRGGNSYTNWQDANKKFDGIIAAVLHSKIHLIACMRSKMDYILEDNGKGKMAPRKVGLAPVMRDGIEYEFTTVFDIALDHQAQASKDRSGLFTDKICQITEATGATLAEWLSGATAKQPATPPAQNDDDEIPMHHAGDKPLVEVPRSKSLSGVSIVRVRNAESKPKAPKPWKAWFCTFSDGTEAGTFSATCGMFMEDCLSVKYDNIEVKMVPGKRANTWQIQSIEVPGIEKYEEI